MEKCMIATSLAFLMCHPNSNTKCSNSCKAINPFPKKPKPHQQETPTRARKPSKTKHVDEPPPVTRLKPLADPSVGALEGILLRGWRPPLRLVIEEVLKVKHDSTVVDKFNRYRDTVKEKVSSKPGVGRRYYKRLMDDGFELLCFIGTNLACREHSTRLGTICRKRHCGVCRLMGVIETSPCDSLRSVLVSESAWMAHQKAMRKDNGRRKAVIVCRVIAGRVMDDRQARGEAGDSRQDDTFDSVFVPLADFDAHDELLVFNPSAILPCFVVLYDVK